MGKKPGVVTWSTLLRNSTGVLRNVSSAGFEGRSKLRSIDGLVDSLVWILKAAIASKNNDINNKVPFVYISAGGIIFSIESLPQCILRCILQIFVYVSLSA